MSITLATVANTATWQTFFTRLNDIVSIVSSNTVTADATTNGSVTIGNSYFLGIFATSNLVANTFRGGNNTVSGTVWVSSNVNINATSLLSVGNSTVNITSNSTQITIVSNTTVNTIANGSAIQLSSNLLINSSTYTVGNATINVVSNSSILRLSANLQINSTYFQVGNTLVNTMINSSSISISGNIINVGFIQSVATLGTAINVSTTGTSPQNIDSYLTNTYRTGYFFVQVTDNNNNNYMVSDMMVTYDGTNVLVTEYAQMISNTVFGTFGVTSNSTAVILQFTPTSTNTTIKGYKQVIPV